MPRLDADAFVRLTLANPVNAALLARICELDLPQGHLAAGCLFQAVWNARSGRPPVEGVRDYDVFYFDDRDLSFAAEDAVIRAMRAATADLDAVVEVRNQARVHLWYADRFGAPYPRLTSARDGIDRFLVSCTCVGIAAAGGTLYAPNGLADLEAGVLRMNPRNPQPARFREKARDYRARWPFLTIAA